MSRGWHRCAVAVCNNTSQVNANNPPEKYVSFHRFPRDTKISEIWFQRCKLTDELNVKEARICSEHFTPEDFERDFQNELLGLPTRKKLKRKAIPTCKLNTAELDPLAKCERKRRAIKRHQRSSLKEILSEPQKVKEEREEEIAIEEVLLPAYPSTSPSSNGDSGCCSITSEYFTLLRKYEEVMDENENLKRDLQRTTEAMENLKEQVKRLEKNCAVADCKNIKDTYDRKKREKTPTDSEAEHEKKKKKWQLAEKLSILQSVENQRKSICNIQSPSAEAVTEDIKEEETDNSQGLDLVGQNTKDSTPTTSVYATELPCPKTADKWTNKATDKTQNDSHKEKKDRIASLLERREKERIEIFKRLARDEEDIDLFFKSIAHSVKKLRPDLRTQAKLQILTLLANLETQMQTSH